MVLLEPIFSTSWGPIDLDELLRLAVDGAARQAGAERGTLFLLDRARDELVSRAGDLPEVREIRLPTSEGVAGWVARHGEAVEVRDAAAEPRFSPRIDEITGFRTRSMLAVPVLGRDDAVVGVLQAVDSRAGAFGRGALERFVETAAQVAALLGATSLRSQLGAEQRQPLAFRLNGVVGESASMQRVYDRALRAARTQASVLVRGESGTGKELVARAIHANSDRRLRPFVKIDCAALPGELVENELFGHERGAFTGAERASDGKVQAAAKGTLFLDEVAELPLAVQGRLLRLVQDRTFYRVGGTKLQNADVRLVAATHRDLEREVVEGRFRQDIYYRLRVVEIQLPPLRERGHGDLARLIDHFFFEACERHGRQLHLGDAARALLHGRSWPGNVRELENAVEAAVVLAPGPEVGAGDIEGGGAGLPPLPLGDLPLPTLAEWELRYIRCVLDRCGGNRSEAARMLGIGRNTLLRKLRG